jgi:hypothetical protein
MGVAGTAEVSHCQLAVKRLTAMESRKDDGEACAAVAGIAGVIAGKTIITAAMTCRGGICDDVLATAMTVTARHRCGMPPCIDVLRPAVSDMSLQRPIPQ